MEVILPQVMIYILLPVAIYLYAVRDSKTLDYALLRGALLGFIMYGFYDLTNYATLTGWTLEMAVTDTLWGVIVCSLGAGVGYIFQ